MQRFFTPISAQHRQDQEGTSPTARIALLSMAALAAFILAVVLQVPPAAQRSVQSLYFSSGGYATARQGDQFVVSSPCRGTVTIFSGHMLVAQLPFRVPGQQSWRVAGLDQYRFDVAPDCKVNVRVVHSTQRFSPYLTGALFMLSAVLLLLACAGSFRNNRLSLADVDLRLIAVIFLGSLLIFLAIPSYLHNDEIGLGFRRNWGYQGWGYIDTARDIQSRLSHFGIAGLLGVQDFGKPIFMPLIASVLAWVFGPLHASVIVSAGLMASAAAGFATLSLRKHGRASCLITAVLFSTNALVLAYATSFYQEIGLLAGLAWAAVFGDVALKTNSRKAALLSILCAAFAISSKHILATPLVIGSLLVLLLYMGNSLRGSVTFCAASGVVGFVSSIALWPRLWTDSAFRIPFALGARVSFDALHGYSAPLSGRLSNEFTTFFTSLMPAEALALLLAAYAVMKGRARGSQYLWIGIALALGFTLPTSLFLQHYLLYCAPFIAMLGGASADLFSGKLTYAPFGLLLALQSVWCALFFPYLGQARLTCDSAECVESSFAPAEPVYGLREAAAWLRSHTAPHDVILAAAAPHTLQAYLPQRQVLFASIFPQSSAAQQQDTLHALRPKYVVENPWSKYYGNGVSTSSLRLVYSTAPRDGGVSIYRWEGTPRAALPDLPASKLAPYISSSSQRILFIGDGAQVTGARLLSGIIQISRLQAVDGPEVSLQNLGTGVVVAPLRSSIAEALAYQTRLAVVGPYGVFISPNGLRAHALASEEMVRTGFGALKALISVPAPLLGLISAYQVRLTGAHVTPADNLSVYAGCSFGRSVAAQLLRTGADEYEALVPTSSEILRACIAADRAVFLETGRGVSKNAHARAMALWATAPNVEVIAPAGAVFVPGAVQRAVAAELLHSPHRDFEIFALGHASWDLAASSIQILKGNLEAVTFSTLAGKRIASVQPSYVQCVACVAGKHEDILKRGAWKQWEYHVSDLVSGWIPEVDLNGLRVNGEVSMDAAIVAGKRVCRFSLHALPHSRPLNIISLYQAHNRYVCPVIRPGLFTVTFYGLRPGARLAGAPRVYATMPTPVESLAGTLQ
jgi:hypothetical protein